jgi:hypothetical protein
LPPGTKRRRSEFHAEQQGFRMTARNRLPALLLITLAALAAPAQAQDGE